MPSRRKPPPPRPSADGTNTAPAPIARELGHDTGWGLWDDVMRKQEAQYAHTTPLTALFPLEGGDRRYARTLPAALTHTAVRPVQPHQRFTVEEVLAEARKGNRVCPRPTRWQQLFDQYSAWTAPGAALPPPPPLGTAWRQTPSLVKRMLFRDHVEWAHANGCLGQLMVFLLSLPEGHWLHIGD